MWFRKSGQLCQETWSLCVWLAVASAGFCKGTPDPGLLVGNQASWSYLCTTGLEPRNLPKPLCCACGLLEEGGRHFTVVTVSSWCPRVLIAGKPAAD